MSAHRDRNRNDSQADPVIEVHRCEEPRCATTSDCRCQAGASIDVVAESRSLYTVALIGPDRRIITTSSSEVIVDPDLVPLTTTTATSMPISTMLPATTTTPTTPTTTTTPTTGGVGPSSSAPARRDVASNDGVADRPDSPPGGSGVLPATGGGAGVGLAGFSAIAAGLAATALARRRSTRT